MASLPSWPEWPEAELAHDVPAFNAGEVLPAGTPVTVLEWNARYDYYHEFRFAVRAPRDPSRVYEEAFARQWAIGNGHVVPPLVESYVTVEVDAEALRRPTRAPRLVVSV